MIWADTQVTHPPFYQSIWFGILVVITVIVVISVAIRLSKKDPHS